MSALASFISVGVQVTSPFPLAFPLKLWKGSFMCHPTDDLSICLSPCGSQLSSGMRSVLMEEGPN